MIDGAFFYEGSFGYTLYYTTNFIFTGLAVSVAFHALLFNIGGEGQAYIGGLGAGLVCLALERGAARTRPHSPRDRGRRGLRRGLGVRPGLAPGLSGKPRRHHHHHVQLHRGGGDGVAARGTPHQAGPELPHLARLRGERAASRHAGGPRLRRNRDRALAAQPLLPARDRGLRLRLAPHLAHPLRLRGADPRAQPAGGRLRRDPDPAHDHPRDGDLRRPRGAHGGERGARRPAPAAPQLHGRLRVHGDRGLPHGPQPPDRDRAREPPLRRPLPGRE